tara:strand:+ start:1638 stop:2702 length:1065 start_codon:yes stop_codon:yes gene_type:complete
MADEANEKTEEATQQRREEFRKRGQVAQSKEVATLLLLTAVALTFWGMSDILLGHIIEVFTAVFGDYIISAGLTGVYHAMAGFLLQKTLFIIAPVLIVTLVVGLSSTLFQVGFVYNEEALQFKPDRINPFSGFKRLFSLRSLMEGAKATIKVGIITFIVFMIVRSEIQNIGVIVEYSIGQILIYFGGMALKLIGAVCLFMGVLAVIDFTYQRWEMEKEMRMSKQEVKEENKNREGDPLIKSRIRRVQREMANKRMMADVPKADVIITNPTHIAVALKYEAGSPAPRLIAKGADMVAQKIKKVAKEHGIPTVENKPLARAIFKTLNIGDWIPRELFKAVAEVLAYVYRLKKRRKA